MVRNYVRKSDRGKSYSKEDLANAIRELEEGLVTLHGAAKKYNIPKSTLHDHAKGTHGTKSQTLGRDLAISLKHEQVLANGLKTLEKWGFGLSRKEVLFIVAEYVTKNNIKTPFKNNLPGADWFINFKQRHKLSIKKPQAVEYSRKKMTDPFVVNEYFTLLEKVLNDLQLNECPQQIWNLDETGLSMDPSKTKVVGAKGVACSRVTSGPGRENITILSAVSANGEKAPPLIVFKGKNMWDQWMAEPDGGPNIAYAASSNGWMETDIFLNYIQKTLIPVLGDLRPVLLIYDGHSTHVDNRVVTLAQENGITILKLPPHTSHLLQPLDLAVFRSFKTAWDEELVSWQRQNQGMKLPKKIFSEKVRKVWNTITPLVIQNGFKKAGIYPFNASVVPNEKYHPEALKRFENLKTCKINETVDVNANDMVSDADIAGPSNASLVNQTDEKQAQATNVSFEDLLLQTVKQSTGNAKVTKKRRVAAGAEVITYQDIDQLPEHNKKHATNKTKKHKDRNHQSTSSESSLEPVYEDSDNDLDFLDDEEANEMENFILNAWILVKYCTKKTIKYYAGKIVEIDRVKRGCVVKFLRYNTEVNQFFWPKKDDTDEIIFENIEKFLPDPTQDEENHFNFNVDFEGLNIA